jgi:hypothetical protein
MLETVFASEQHLFTPDEVAVHSDYIRLGCKHAAYMLHAPSLIHLADPARFLLAKLALRSPKWHRLLGSKLSLSSYARELGGDLGVVQAGLAQLCGLTDLETRCWVVQDVTPADWLDMIAADVARHRTSTTAADTTTTKKRAGKAAAQPIDLTQDSDEEPASHDATMRPPALTTRSISPIRQGSSEAGPSRVKQEPSSPPPPYSPPVKMEDIKTEQQLGTAMHIDPRAPVPIPKPEAVPPLSPRRAVFALDVRKASLEDLLGVLSGPELKKLAKEQKLKLKGTVCSNSHTKFTLVTNNRTEFGTHRRALEFCWQMR